MALPNRRRNKRKTKVVSAPAVLSPRQRGFAVAALAAMLAPAIVTGTAMIDWVNVATRGPIAASSLGPADLYAALTGRETELGAGGRLPETDELGAELLRDLEDGLDDLDDGVNDVPDGPLGIPGVMLDAYMRAEDRLAELKPGCNLDWPLLAAIGRIESNHARGGKVDAKGNTSSPILGPVLNGSLGFAAIQDTDAGRWDGDRTWDRAVGPMQFIPQTWAGHGADGNDDGESNPNNIYDATVGAGKYLCSGGGDLSKDADRAAAVFRYNRSDAYVRDVLEWAKAYSQGVDTLPSLPDNTVPPSNNNPPGTTPPGTTNPTVPPSLPPNDRPTTTTTTPSNPCPTTTTTTPTSTSSTTSSTTTTTPSGPTCPTTTTPPSSSTTSSNPPVNTPPASSSTTSSSSTPPANTPSTNTPSTNTPSSNTGSSTGGASQTPSSLSSSTPS